MREFEDVSLDSFDVDAVRAVLADGPISVAVLYGSHARGEATGRSDIDLAIGFDESLSSTERTRARLRLIVELTQALGSDEVDVVPLSRMPATLRREVAADGVVLYGAVEDRLETEDVDSKSHEERLAEFDEMLADLRKVV